MKRNYSNLLFILACVIAPMWSCKNDAREGEIYTVPIGNPVSGLRLSDIFQLDGFSQLHARDMAQGLDRLRGIDKVLFTDRQIVVLDNKTDFQRIWLFDRETGVGLGKCAYPTSEPGGMADIALGPDGEISCLAAGNMAFFNFDATGGLTRSLKNGVIGDQIVRLSNGGYLTYNEYSATDISGHYQLLFFDKAGNLTQRLYPYDPELDDIGYALSGFTSKSDDRIWFSPPFCDTVYEVTGRRLEPRYLFDFGDGQVPELLRKQKIGGWDVDPYLFLGEDFIKINQFSLFSYFSSPQTNLGVYDERSGAFFKFRDAAHDHLYEIMRAGRIFPKDGHAFVFVLTPGRIRYLLENKRTSLDGLKNSAPELYQAFLHAEQSDGDPDPLLLYFSFKPGVRIASQPATRRI